MNSKRNIKLVIEYDGTKYAGWQRQENAVAVQEKIESALSTILQQQTTIVGAGRTDAGVHARGQVASFHTESSFDTYSLQAGLNGLLPDDIVVHSVEEAPANFNARHSACARRYSYTISRRETALLRHYSWHLRYELDVPLMKTLCKTILGNHDFRSFCRAQTESDHYRCHVLFADWAETNSFLIFTIEADRFLHGMVRTLVGTMIDIGRKHTEAEEFVRILEHKDRTTAGMAVPAKGLVLEKVLY